MNDDPPSPPAAPPIDDHEVTEPAAQPTLNGHSTRPDLGCQARDPEDLFLRLKACAEVIETTAYATARRAGMIDPDAARVAGRVTAGAMRKIERLHDPAGYAAATANTEVIRIIRKTALDAARRSRASPDDAEDIAQRVVMRIIAVPVIRSDLLACTRRAAHRLHSNQVRDLRRRAELLARHVRSDDQPRQDLGAVVDLLRAVAELPGDQGDALRRAGAGASREEIARAQGVSTNTASSRVRLARRHIAKVTARDE
jgi:DNA-directed RNA polymerase specialized sigma24 family protein